MLEQFNTFAYTYRKCPHDSAIWWEYNGAVLVLMSIRLIPVKIIGRIYAYMSALIQWCATNIYIYICASIIINICKCSIHREISPLAGGT